MPEALCGAGESSCFQELGGILLGSARFDHPRGDGVDPDPVLSPFDRERLGQVVYPGARGPRPAR